jgi:hypothetical protein
MAGADADEASAPAGFAERKLAKSNDCVHRLLIVFASIPRGRIAVNRRFAAGS